MTDPLDVLRRMVAAETSGWTPQQKAALLHRLGRESTRITTRDQYTTAGQLAQALDPKTVQTPALEVVDEALEWALSERDARLIISVSPQEGKSSRVAVWGVIRALVQDPTRRIVISSYSDFLARTQARQARNIIREYGTGATDPVTGADLPDRLGLALADDKSAAGNWKIAGHGGGVYAVGVGGSLTGSPADCIVGSTVLHCEYGPITAKEAYTNPPKYLMGYNERTGQPTWHRLEATRRIDRRPVVKVTTRGGKSLTCTEDHRVYTGGRYTPAGNLRPGETLLHLDTSTRVPDMQSTIHGETVRGTKDRYSRQPDALLKDLRIGERIPAVPNQILPLRRPRAEVTPFDMQRQLSTREVPAGATTRRLPGMREGIYSQIVPNNVLQPRLCRSGALEAHDGGGELASPASVVCNIPLSAGATARNRTGRVPLCDLRNHDRSNRASLRREPGKQSAGEPHNPLFFLSRDTPQINHDPVSVVADVGEATVYDFQVDGDNNFFANGLLVHNCMIIDDPYKSMAEADSKAEREKVITWWESVAQTRLAPGAPVIIIQTRWHADDLAGHLISRDQLTGRNEWRVVNIPAISTPGVPDALGRKPGVAMESARGRTQADFERIRQDVGERVWAALYLGVPTPPQGGLFSQEWFDRNRAPEAPEGVATRLVAVDPAETGKGDEAGIIGVSVTPDGRAWVTDDRSGTMQSDEWARAAVLLALETGAGEVSYEAFSAKETYGRVIEDAWRRVRREAVILAEHDGDLMNAVSAYSRDEYAPQDPLAALQEVNGLRVPDQPEPPFRVNAWRMPGDKTARAAGTRQAASTGRLRLVGTHPTLEGQAVTWQQGQSSPDRLDALVQGFERAMDLVGRDSQIASPTDMPAQSGGLGASFWQSTIG